MYLGEGGSIVPCESGLRLNYRWYGGQVDMHRPSGKPDVSAAERGGVPKYVVAHSYTEMSPHVWNCMDLTSSRKTEFVKKINYKFNCSPVPVK